MSLTEKKLLHECYVIQAFRGEKSLLIITMLIICRVVQSITAICCDYISCSPSCTNGFPSGSLLSPHKKYVSRCIGDAKMPLDVNVCACCPLMHWHLT